MKRKTREEKAITLIALIITIVVLLILAVVAINAVTGDGIIQHATNGKNEYEKAKIKEQSVLESYMDKIQEKISDNTTNYDSIMKSIAHRGYNLSAPENTIPAFALAKQIGFNYVETDVTFTSDNIPVLLHDDTIDRTSNGTGKINETTYSQVRQYDFGSWKSNDYVGTKIPTFEEFIIFCKNNNIHPYIEIVDSISYPESQIKILTDIVNNYDMSGKVTWISFELSFLEYVKYYDESARLGYLTERVVESTINQMKNLKTDKNEIFINSSVYSSDVISLCKGESIPLEIWTINNTSIIKNIDPYISGITSDGLLSGKILSYIQSYSDKPYIPEYEIIKEINSSNISYKTVLLNSYPYYSDRNTRASYVNFDIIIQSGYIYKFDFETTVSSMNIGIHFTNDLHLTGSSNIYDTGWQESGFEIEIPESGEFSELMAVRLTFKNSDNSNIIDNSITGVTISRKSIQ